MVYAEQLAKCVVYYCDLEACSISASLVYDRFVI